MTPVSPEQFAALLKNRKRQLVLTRHAKARSVQRLMDETVVTRDLYTETPLKVAEQPSETEGERKFDAYYLQHTGVYHRYVVSGGYRNGSGG